MACVLPKGNKPKWNLKYVIKKDKIEVLSHSAGDICKAVQYADDSSRVVGSNAVYNLLGSLSAKFSCDGSNTFMCGPNAAKGMVNFMEAVLIKSKEQLLKTYDEQIREGVLVANELLNMQEIGYI
ncbi:hypothetical protein N0V90_004164 [Kalmusia sp. IMI 367209]|nr:hypothetical protein N0V90_004164 [Kalmusia sp. IMI 367209]